MEGIAYLREIHKDIPTPCSPVYSGPDAPFLVCDELSIFHSPTSYEGFFHFTEVFKLSYNAGFDGVGSTQYFTGSPSLLSRKFSVPCPPMQRQLLDPVLSYASVLVEDLEG
jgi:hypothetical protein